MNIFVTDKDPVVAAQNLCDKHINKMIVESAQMLANTFSLERLAESDCPRSQKGSPRSHGYSKHPCTLWTCKSKANIQWLIEHALEMNNERKYRWEDKPDHFSIEFIKWCKENLDDSEVEETKLTEFAIAISDNMHCRQAVNDFDSLSAVDKYRLYYKHDKPFAKWTKRLNPSWYE